MVRCTSVKADQCEGCSLEPLLRNLAGFVSTGPPNELGGGSSIQQAGCPTRGSAAGPREGKRGDCYKLPDVYMVIDRAVKFFMDRRSRGLPGEEEEEEAAASLAQETGWEPSVQ